MGPTDDGDDIGQDLPGDSDGLAGGVVVHAHHRDPDHVGGTLRQDFPELVPAGEGAQVNQVYLKPLRFGGRAERGQAVGNPAGVHPLLEGIPAPTGDTGINQSDLQTHSGIREKYKRHEKHERHKYTFRIIFRTFRADGNAPKMQSNA